jgi:hypothetical protein
MSEKAFKGCGCQQAERQWRTVTDDSNCIAPRLAEALEAVVEYLGHRYGQQPDEDCPVCMALLKAKSALAAAYGSASTTEPSRSEG